MDDASVADSFRRWGHLIYRHCSRLVGPVAAEDLTQEVFLRLWARRREVLTEAAGGRPSAWIYRVATNACVDHLRTRKQHAELEPEHAPDHRPERGVAARAHLIQLLARWDDRTRAIVLLVLGAGYTQDEAAEILGLSRRTVGTRLRQFQSTLPAVALELDAG